MAELFAWQCSRCGKWSHAKRKPKYHERWVESYGWTPPGDVLALRPDDIVIRESEYSSNPDDVPHALIKCGPFNGFRLVPIDGGQSHA